jgi:hypothetical protein
VETSLAGFEGCSLATSALSLHSKEDSAGEQKQGHNNEHKLQMRTLWEMATGYVISLCNAYQEQEYSWKELCHSTVSPLCH